MEYTVDKTISLIYFWLKENHLLKTCRSLQEEYGKAIPEPEGSCSLQNIVRTYHSVFTLVSSVQQTIKSTKVPKKSKKTEKSTESEEGGSKTQKYCTSKDTNSSTENKDKASFINSNKKKQKQPFMPKGQWVCPEMENILCNVFDRCTLMIGQNNTHPGPPIEGSPKSTCITNIRNDNTTNGKVDVESSTHENGKVTSSNVVQDSKMFTSDSESDSGDDIKPTSVKQRKDVMLESTDQPQVVPQKMIVNNSVQNSIKENEKNEKQHVELNETKVKKKKSKVLLPNISHVFDGDGEGNLHVKKKKKRKVSDFENTYNQTENSSEGKTAVKKKLKKHKQNGEDIHTVIDDNYQSPVKMAKKAKLETLEKENMLGIEFIKKKKQKYFNSEELGNEIILNNLSETLKKKKKKKY